jgi:hypothetical protein
LFIKNSRLFDSHLASTGCYSPFCIDGLQRQGDFMKAAPLKGAASSQIGELYRCEGFPQSKSARSRIRVERDDLEYRMPGGQSADRAGLAPHRICPKAAKAIARRN